MAVRISPVRRTIPVTIYIQMCCVDLESLALDLPAPLQADGCVVEMEFRAVAGKLQNLSVHPFQT